MLAQDDALFGVDEYPAAVNHGNLLPGGIQKAGDALVYRVLAGFGLGDGGQLLVHLGRAGDVQGELCQHKGGVGGGVDFIGQSHGFGVDGGDLLGVAQQRTGLDKTAVVPIVTIYGEFLGVGGHRLRHTKSPLPDCEF